MNKTKNEKYNLPRSEFLYSTLSCICQFLIKSRFPLLCFLVLLFIYKIRTWNMRKSEIKSVVDYGLIHHHTLDTNYVALWLHEKYLTHEQRQTSPLPFITNLIQVIMLFTSWKKWKHILNDKECWQQNIKPLYGIDTSFVHVCRSDQFSIFFLERVTEFNYGMRSEFILSLFL